MARLKKHGVKIRNIDRGVPTRVANQKKNPNSISSKNNKNSYGPHSPALQNENGESNSSKIKNFFKKQAKKKNKMLMDNGKKSNVINYFNSDVLLLKVNSITDIDSKIIYDNYLNLLYNVDVQENCSFTPYHMTHECSMNIRNIKKMANKYNIYKFDFNIDDKKLVLTNVK